MTARTIDLPSRRATRQLGSALGRSLAPGDLVVFSGALGAGKTFLVRGALRVLGVPVREPITSPTFAIVHEYDTVPPVFHADLYRVGDASDLGPLGLREARASGAALLVEWGDPFAAALGGDALSIALSVSASIAGSERRAQLAASGPRSLALLERVGAALERAGRKTC